jgi:diacylglycerol kinase family enzyme
MGKLRLLRTLVGLLFGRFRGRPGTRSFFTTSIAVSADAPFLLEVDGEVGQVVEASFDLFAPRIRVCA